MLSKTEFGSFVNEFGHKEKYVIKDLTIERTGHVNRYSNFCTSYDCSNCDGVLCDMCEKHYIVRKYSEPMYNPELGYNEIKMLQINVFTNEKEAIAFYEKL